MIKKPTKNGKLNTIHLYPIKKDEKKISLKAAIEHDRNPGFLEGSNASPKVEKMMDVQKYEDEPVGMETSHYEEEHKEKIKIKHHHHHHHHNHIKTVIKKEPYPVEKIVPKPYPVEKIVEKIVHMPVEKIIHKPFPVPYPVEKVVEKVVHIPKPYPVKEYVEKKVPYPVEKVIEKVVEKIVPKYIHIPKPYPVIKHVHVPIEVKVPGNFFHRLKYNNYSYPNLKYNFISTYREKSEGVCTSADRGREKGLYRHFFIKIYQV